MLRRLSHGYAANGNTDKGGEIAPLPNEISRTAVHSFFMLVVYALDIDMKIASLSHISPISPSPLSFLGTLQVAQYERFADRKYEGHSLRTTGLSPPRAA
jgi:hypothetical protein